MISCLKLRSKFQDSKLSQEVNRTLRRGSFWQDRMHFFLLCKVVGLLRISQIAQSESLFIADFKKTIAGFQAPPFIGYVQSLQKVRSLLECASVCKYTQKCMTYAYDIDTCTCMTFWRPPLFLHMEAGKQVYFTTPCELTYVLLRRCNIWCRTWS